MNIVKELDKLNKNIQHIYTCTRDVQKYNLEVINNTTNNTKVTVGISDNSPKTILSLENHKNVIIFAGYSKMFLGVTCVRGEKIFIESTIKDVSIIISEV